MQPVGRGSTSPAPRNRSDSPSRPVISAETSLVVDGRIVTTPSVMARMDGTDAVWSLAHRRHSAFAQGGGVGAWKRPPAAALLPVRSLAQIGNDRYNALSPKLESEAPTSSRRS